MGGGGGDAAFFRYNMVRLILPKEYNSFVLPGSESNMLTKIRIKNFKRFDDVEIDLGKAVVLIGPNNSGKTTALQALALWDIGLRRWNEKRQKKSASEKRPGVAINRRDLISVPVPNASLLWHSMHVKKGDRQNGKPSTQNIRIDIIVEGLSDGKEWKCGLEFDYANEESFYCRPLRLTDEENPKRMEIPSETSKIRVAYLPPMSGLAAVEPKWEPGRINVLLGEGQTAQVLRNLCFNIHEKNPQTWNDLNGHIKKLFGVRLIAPDYIQERGEIAMSYEEQDGTRLDIASSGRGLQQTLLLLAHLYANPGTVLLLDEPDAHLEVLRQRQTYQLLTEVANQQGSQIVAASHSEVVLNEAADRDMVIAFVGRPHRIDGRVSQVMKSLTDLGYDQYYQAEQMGWVLYVEGPTDLAILQTFARKLGHPAEKQLERPFVYYVATNLPQKARDHFYGLREAKPNLVGIAIFDRLDKELQSDPRLTETMWQKREIENYFTMKEVLIAYTQTGVADDLFGYQERERRKAAMIESIHQLEGALSKLRKPSPWSSDIKVTDEFLDPLFDEYFGKLGLPNLLRKSDYYSLAELVPTDKIHPDIREKLDAIIKVASKAKPSEI
ncbi:MAG: AAA family ATPase [Chloroflexota bacterium]